MFKRLACLLLLAAFVFAAETPDPKSFGYSELSISLKWVVESSEDTTLKVFAFQNTSFQTVEFAANLPYALESDSQGNTLLAFRWNPAKQGKEVAVDSRLKIDFSKGGYAGTGSAEFLGPSQYVVLDADAKATALSIVSGVQSDYEKLVRLTEWVHNNVVYDTAYWDKIENSSTVLAVKHGVCDEYSHLLISFLRSAGIPARFVAGLVYSGKEWQAHAWSEAFVDGKWVPADATFNEVGWLDATHAPFALGRDQGDVNEQVSQGAALSKTEPQVSVVSRTGYPDFFGMAFVKFPQKVGPGSAEDAVLEIESRSGEQRAVPVSLVVPTSPSNLAVKIVGAGDVLVYMPPRSKKTVSWSLIFPSAMEEGYDYNFTVAAVSPWKNASFTAVGTKFYAPNVLRRLSIQNVGAKKTAAGVELFFEVTNDGNVGLNPSIQVSVAGFSAQESASIAAGQTKQIKLLLPPFDSGGGEIRIKYDGETVIQPINLSLEAPPTPTPVSQQPDYSAYLPHAVGAVVLLLAAFIILRRRA